MTMSTLITRAATVAAGLEKTAAQVGRPNAVRGDHVAGPVRGQSIVTLSVDVAKLLRELIAALEAGQTDAPVEPAPASVPVVGTEASRNRFRGLME